MRSCPLFSRYLFVYFDINNAIYNNLKKLHGLENFIKLPQELISFELNEPTRILMNSAVKSEISKLENKLGEEGRVLIRPSGTENLLRVMIEASTKELASNLARELSDFIRKAA